MAVSTQVPLNWKVPLFWATVDGTKAGNVTAPARALLVGQSFTTGTQAQNIPVAIGSRELANQMFGQGSMLGRMVNAFMNSNTNQQLWAIGIPDPAAGVAATGTITIATPPTASGVLSIYIAGQLVQITVGQTDTPTIIATNLASQIQAQPDLPVTATAAVAVVTLTSKWKGLTANEISIVPNFLGQLGGQAFPIGLTLTIVAMASGAGTPLFTSAISAIQMLAFDYVALPYTDTASMSSWATEYGFGTGGRWGYMRQQYGMIFSAWTDTYSNLITWGIGNNNAMISTMAIEQDSPAPLWEWAAAYCALGALGYSDDPARPLQTLEFYGILPARLPNRFTQGQLNSLANSGMAIQATSPDGNPMIMREQTQYQVNSYGQADTAFGLLSTLATLQMILRTMASAITSKYARVKLIPDGTKIGPGQAAVTPTDIKGELISEFMNMMYNGWVSDLADFKANLIVQIDNNDPTRVDVLWPPQLVSGLRVFAVLAQFRLQYPPQPV
jgi:phage tail sheath gpL-like